MNFFIVSKDGSENGPHTEEALVAMAKKHEITHDTAIRNALMNKTNPAEKLPFLSEHLVKKTKADDKIARRDPLSRSVNAIKAASFGYRSGAAFIDMIIIYAFIGGLAFLINNSLASGSIATSTAAAYLIAGAYFITLLYYTVNIGFYAQTPGQRFYGIMATNKTGDAVLLNQALIYSFFFVICFPLAPVVVYLTKKSLQEYISGVQIVNIRLG